MTGEPRAMELKRKIAVRAAGASRLGAVPATEAATHKYPSSVTSAFVKGCKQGGGTSAQCKCTIRKAERKYTYKQFKAILRKIDETGDLPPAMQRIVASCAKKYPS